MRCHTPPQTGARCHSRWTAPGYQQSEPQINHRGDQRRHGRCESHGTAARQRTRRGGGQGSRTAACGGPLWTSGCRMTMVGFFGSHILKKSAVC